MITSLSLAAATHPEDPWLITETDYPAQGTVEEQLEFLVGYAVLAPSRFNSQPWGFIRRDTVLELRLDETRVLPVTDSRGREAIMNCGTALYFLRIAMQFFGHTPRVEIFPEETDSPVLAWIQQGEPYPVDEETQALFHAIRHRRTHKGQFRADPLPSELYPALQDMAAQENAALVFLTDSAQRQAVTEMVLEGEDILQQNPDYRHEAAAWKGDVDRVDWVYVLTTFFRETFGRPRLDPDLIRKAPALAVLGTDNDTPYDWLAAGQALGAVLLKADTAWVQASFLNQPIEVLPIRPRLQQLVDGVTPQLILRLGLMEGHYLPHTPRRSARLERR